MSKLCRIDIERLQEVSERLDSYVAELVSRLDPDLILVFGSYARGDVSEGSDIDVLVVAGFEESFLDRIRTLMEMNVYGLPVEPVGYTREEFERMRGEGNRFIAHVLETGRTLYSK